MLELTPAEVRATLLGAQGLLVPPVGTPDAAAILATIQRMAALQIDAINVVARSHYLVLWSRLGPYDTVLLDDLLANGQLFEYWSHAACFLPIEDYPLYRRRMLDDAARSHAWLAANAAVADGVRARLRAEGELRTSAFGRGDGSGAGWWNWRPEKHALEALHTTGEVMIARREGFQRVYTLRERILPDWDDAHALTPEGAARAYAERAARALGVATARWVAPYFKLPKRGIAATLETLADEGTLLRARVARWEGPAYLHPDHLALLEAIRAGTLQPGRTVLLSPFDPLARDRERALELYDFHYRIEVYTPLAQRRYGYFTLPLLHGDRLVGRLDPKVDRKAGRLIVRAAHLEPGIPPDEALVAGLAGNLLDLARFLAVPEVVVERSDPPALAPALRASLAARPDAPPIA